MRNIDVGTAIALPLLGALALAGFIVPWANASAADSGSQDPIVCWVSILPQKYFVERIGGDLVKVDVMVGPGQSPATYEPTGRQLAGLSKAAFYFSIGVAFERSLVPRIVRSFPDTRVVDTSIGIERRAISGHTHEEPGGGPAELEDPHVWLSPILAARVARNIERALSAADPGRASVYAENLTRLEKELDETNRAISEILAPYRGRAIFVFHPAYGYFTDEYGLVQIPIEIDGGQPGPRHLAELIDRAKAEAATTVFVQRQFSASSARTVARTIGAKVVVLDPLAENYSDNLIEMARLVAAALENGGSTE